MVTSNNFNFKTFLIGYLAEPSLITTFDLLMNNSCL